MDFDFEQDPCLKTIIQNPNTTKVAKPAKMVKITKIYSASELSQSDDSDVEEASESTKKNKRTVENLTINKKYFWQLCIIFLLRIT